MVDRGQIITVGLVVVIVAAVVFGMTAISNMTGSITGSVADDDAVIENEYFRIDGGIDNLNNSNSSEVKDGDGRRE